MPLALEKFFLDLNCFSFLFIFSFFSIKALVVRLIDTLSHRNHLQGDLMCSFWMCSNHMEMNRPFLQVVYVFDKVHRLHLLVLCNSHIWHCSMPLKPELRYWRLFSSPEPKAQVNFSDQNLSVVRRRRCCCRCRYCRCRKLFTLSSSPEPLANFN